MNLRMPQPGAPIAGPGGLITREWRDFLMRLLGTEVGVGLQEQIDQINAQIAALGGDGAFLPSSTRIYGESSVASFGTLAGGLVTFTLQNDVDSPGETFYYGTGADGGKGWFPLSLSSLSDVSVSSPNDGDSLVWSESGQKWIASPISFSFGRPLTDESGNILTDPNGNILTDGKLSIDWADVDNKPNTDQIPEGLVNLYIRRAALTDQSGRVITDQSGRPILTNNPQIPLAWIPGVQAAVKEIYPLSALPRVTPYPREIYVSGTSGVTGIIPAYSDGTNWLRFSDNTPVN